MKKLRTILTCGTFILSFFFLGVFFPSAAVAKDKVIELKYATLQVPFGPSFEMFKEWAAEFEKRTNGRAKITLYFSGSLVKGKEIRKAVLKGLCDIGYMNIGLDPSAYRLNSVMELPFMGFKDSKAARRIWLEIIEKFPEMKKEFKGTKVLWQNIFMPHMIHTTKKEIRVPGDIKGEKIAGMGMNLKILDALGASPVSLMPTEAYLGLERGVADGVMAAHFPMLMLRLTGLLNYHNNTVLNYNTGFVIASNRSWKRLPPDIQKILVEMSPEYCDREWAISMGLEEKGQKAAEKMGHTFTTNTPEEIMLWEQAAKPYQEKWIAGNESKGKPGRAVFEEVKRLAAEYRN